MTRVSSSKHTAAKPQARKNTHQNDTNMRLPTEIIEQAAHWHTLMQSGEVNFSDKAAFNAWHANAEHAQAYQRMALMWQQVDEIDLAPARTTLQAVLTEQQHNSQNKQQAKKRALNTFASVGLVVLGVSIGSQFINDNNRLVNYISSGYLFSDHRTEIGENKVITLSDNTRIHLNTFSAINVEITAKHRIIHLLQGEIQLDVAKHKTKSLIVKTEQGSARALGTQFVVRERGKITDVSVTESRVEVCTATKSTVKSQASNISANHNLASSPKSTCQQLTAGQQTHINNQEVLLPKAISKQFTHHWSQQLLIVENQPVLKVLDELHRYHHGYISIDRKALAHHVVSGVFPLNDLTKSLQVLEGSLAIKVNTYTPLLTVIKAKNK